MRTLRRLHLYLGCLFAPMLIFFAVTGSWQIFYWHEGTKGTSDGGHGYNPPHVLVALSRIHKEAHLPPTERWKSTPLRYFMFAAALGLVLTAVVGVIMAYRFSREPLVATVCLALGIFLPAILLWIYH
jgi:uncharacterized iron-regulated membrane protein